MRLDGKRAFITGGARGIGLAIASELVDRGCAVALSDIDEIPLAEAAGALQEKGGEVDTLVLDVTDASAVAGLPSRLGDIDVLVNNAGTVMGGAFLDVDPADHARVIEVNLEGLMRVTHALLGGLIARPESAIVNLASAAGFVGLPYAGPYAATKWGVLGFGESLRLELAESGHRHVHLTHVCPSYVDTELFAGAAVLRSTRRLTPSGLARKVVRAVERNRLWVRTPWLVAMTPMLRGILPQAVTDRILRASGATRSMVPWRGRQG
ncbi:MAG: SDR family NAD(P)-dependent oxidoreductase [Phycisphaerales bacterium]|nr:SDR family NAD(P)-dependent oxidoreductase [Phycisphaerales bacterium]